MKKLLIIIACVLVATLQAQTDGISYQAVILNPDAQQIPGPDTAGNVLPETEIALRFTILNEDGSVVYQEVLETMTDLYGMVNVFIGSGIPGPIRNFNEINWDGTPRSLAVEIDLLRGRGFTFLSQQRLTFIPQAYHRNIIADGDLSVNGTATFNSDFVIEGQTIINSDLDVAGDLNVGEDLTVDEDLIVGEDVDVGFDLTVEGRTDLNGGLFVNNGTGTNLSGILEVGRSATIAQRLTVGGSAVIEANIEGNSNINIAGNQRIGGRSDIVGGQSIGGNHNVTGNEFISGDSNITGNQRVLLNQNIDGEQTVSGNSNIGGSLNVGENAFIDGAAQVGSSLNVAGEGIFNTRITVAGETNLLGVLNVEGDTTINDDTIINGDLDIEDFITVGQGGTIGGNLDIFGKSTVSQSLKVGGATALESSLKVNNFSPVFLSGILQVDGRSVFKSDLNVTDQSSTVLSGSLNVGLNAFFGEDVEIDGMLTVNNNLSINGLTVSGNNSDHIAVFENSGANGADGIAVRINTPQLSSDNRFMTFYGQDDYVAGKIESYEGTSNLNQGGVVYGSTGADYAEWLEKEDPNQSFRIGEVVGVKGGKISRNTNDVDHVLTISMAPIVLGNMPDENRKMDFEKVGFMGQVPALVKGKVDKGDYIIASGNHDGYAIAISPEEIKLGHLRYVIGKAWSSSQGQEETLINVSVGLKSNEWVHILEEQETRIQDMEAQLKSLQNVSKRLEKLESKIDALDMN